MERFQQLLLAATACILVSCASVSALGGVVDELVGEIAPRKGNLTAERKEIEGELTTFGEVIYFKDKKSFMGSSESKDRDVSSKLDSRCPVILSDGNRTLVKVLSNLCSDDAEVEFKINEGSWRSYLIFLADDGDDNDKNDLVTMDTVRDLCTDDCCDGEYNLDQGGKYCYHVLINEDQDLDEECTKEEDFKFECDE